LYVVQQKIALATTLPFPPQSKFQLSPADCAANGFGGFCSVRRLIQL